MPLDLDVFNAVLEFLDRMAQDPSRELPAAPELQDKLLEWLAQHPNSKVRELLEKGDRAVLIACQVAEARRACLRKPDNYVPGVNAAARVVAVGAKGNISFAFRDLVQLQDKLGPLRTRLGYPLRELAGATKALTVGNKVALGFEVGLVLTKATFKTTVILQAVVFGLETLFYATQWFRGRMTGREFGQRFAIALAGNAGGVGGAVAGGMIGASLGALGGPIGAIIGFVVGAVAASWQAENLIRKLIEEKFADGNKAKAKQEMVDNSLRTLDFRAGTLPDWQIIRKKFHEKILVSHPDRKRSVHENQETINAQAQAIIDSYAILKEEYRAKGLLPAPDAQFLDVEFDEVDAAKKQLRLGYHEQL